jgi:thiol-disulfide isomerase/thioredoxin
MKFLTKNRFKSLLINIAIFIAVLIAVQTWQARNAPSGQAPSLPYTSLGLHEQRLLPQSNGKIELLYFFAPWCQVCQVSIANVKRAASYFDNAKPHYIALDFEQEDEVNRFIDEHLKPQDPGDVYLADDRAKAAWGVNAYPTYVIVGADGSIKHVSVGYSTTAGVVLRLWLASVL